MFGNNCSFVRCRKKKRCTTEHKRQRHTKTADWPSETAALNHDRCFCSVDGLNYCNIRGSGAHLSASFVESDTRRGGCSPLFSRGQLDKNNETRSARQKGLLGTLFKINSPCTVWQDDLFLSGFAAQRPRFKVRVTEVACTRQSRSSAPVLKTESENNLQNRFTG